MDIENWESLEIPRDYAEKQLQIIVCYKKLLGLQTRSHACHSSGSKVPRKGTSQSLGRVLCSRFRKFNTGTENKSRKCGKRPDLCPDWQGSLFGSADSLKSETVQEHWMSVKKHGDFSDR